jgi:hypothetical protein
MMMRSIIMITMAIETITDIMVVDSMMATSNIALPILSPRRTISMAISVKERMMIKDVISLSSSPDAHFPS